MASSRAVDKNHNDPYEFVDSQSLFPDTQPAAPRRPSLSRGRRLTTKTPAKKTPTRSPRNAKSTKKTPQLSSADQAIAQRESKDLEEAFAASVKVHRLERQKRRNEQREKQEQSSILQEVMELQDPPVEDTTSTIAEKQEQSSILQEVIELQDPPVEDTAKTIAEKQEQSSILHEVIELQDPPVEDITIAVAIHDNDLTPPLSQEPKKRTGLSLSRKKRKRQSPKKIVFEQMSPNGEPQPKKAKSSENLSAEEPQPIKDSSENVSVIQPQPKKAKSKNDSTMEPPPEKAKSSEIVSIIELPRNKSSENDSTIEPPPKKEKSSEMVLTIEPLRIKSSEKVFSRNKSIDQAPATNTLQSVTTTPALPLIIRPPGIPPDEHAAMIINHFNNYFSHLRYAQSRVATRLLWTQPVKMGTSRTLSLDCTRKSRNSRKVSLGYSPSFIVLPKRAKLHVAVNGSQQTSPSGTPVNGSEHLNSSGAPVNGSQHTSPSGTPVNGSQHTSSSGAPVNGSQHTSSSGAPVNGSQHTSSSGAPVNGSQHLSSSGTPVNGSQHTSPSGTPPVNGSQHTAEKDEGPPSPTLPSCSWLNSRVSSKESPITKKKGSSRKTPKSSKVPRKRSAATQLILETKEDGHDSEPCSLASADSLVRRRRKRVRRMSTDSEPSQPNENVIDLTEDSQALVSCPLCSRQFPPTSIERHASKCLGPPNPRGTKRKRSYQPTLLELQVKDKEVASLRGEAIDSDSDVSDHGTTNPLFEELGAALDQDDELSEEDTGSLDTDAVVCEQPRLIPCEDGGFMVDPDTITNSPIKGFTKISDLESRDERREWDFTELAQSRTTQSRRGHGRGKETPGRKAKKKNNYYPRRGKQRGGTKKSRYRAK